MKARARVLAALARRAGSVVHASEVLEETGLARHTVSVQLSRLLGAGEVERVGRALYIIRLPGQVVETQGNAFARVLGELDKGGVHKVEDLAKALGLSRTSVRQALREAKAAGAPIRRFHGWRYSTDPNAKVEEAPKRKQHTRTLVRREAIKEAVRALGRGKATQEAVAEYIGVSVKRLQQYAHMSDSDVHIETVRYVRMGRKSQKSAKS